MLETGKLAFHVLVLVLLCCTGIFAKEIDFATEVDVLLQRLTEEYPPSGIRLPKNFAQNANARRLIQLINSNFEPYIAITHMIPSEHYKSSKQSEEELEIMDVAASSSGLAWKSAKEKRTEEEWRLFEAKLEEYVEKGKRESRKQEIALRSLELWALDHKAFLIKQLEHINWHIRAIAIHLLFQFVPDERVVVDALLKTLPPEYPYYDGDLSGEKCFLVENPVKIVKRFSAWRIPEVLPYVQKLGKHPFYHYRRDSMKYIKHYGIQESVPHMIKLLDDQAGLVRAEAFGNLVLLTGTGLGQNTNTWHSDKLSSVERAKHIQEWEAWWKEHGKEKPDIDFHISVVDSALLLMEEHGPWNFKETFQGQPIRIIEEHLNTGISTRQSGADIVSKFKAFWRKNKNLLTFDEAQQKLVLRSTHLNRLQQDASPDPEPQGGTAR